MKKKNATLKLLMAVIAMTAVLSACNKKTCPAYGQVNTPVVEQQVRA